MPGRRFGRSSKRSPRGGSSSGGGSAAAAALSGSASGGLSSPNNSSSVVVPYEPPQSLDDGADSSPGNFVIEPPKPARGLTGKISTLFRREANSAAVRQSRSADEVGGRHRQQHPNARISVTSDDDDDGDERSVGARSTGSSRRSRTKRIFYSSHQDDDSDDSYESRASGGRRKNRSRSVPRGGGGGGRRSAVDGGSSTDGGADYSRDIMSTDDSERPLTRFRGFSTSIKSLFLDEALVCAAVGCFGLILSNRTEYLLQLRNERRGALSPSSRRGAGSSRSKKMPSRIIAWSLLVTLALMFTTFIVWGFGTGSDSVADSYFNGYDYYEDDDRQQNQQWWDDYLSNDDNNNNNDDGGNNNNNDDGGGNYNDQNNNDDAAAAGDDANNNDDDANNNNNEDGGNNNRRRIVELDRWDGAVYRRRPTGIFKIRDYQENLWDPLAAFVQNEWYREDHEELDAVPDARHRQTEEQGYVAWDDYLQNNNGNSNYNNQGNSNSNNDDGGGGTQSVSRKQPERDIASNVRIALLFLFILFLGILGRRRRMRTRFYIVKARAQEDHLYYASSDAAAARRVAYDDSREDQYEGACSHTLCGCYPVDEVQVHDDDEDEQVQVTDRGIFRRKRKRHHEDIVARGFNCIMACCCGVLFKCWFQCLSICALAQEAREVRLLIPPRYQRIDFITHQPFHEYQEAVNNLRRGWLGKARRMSGIMPHFNALSRLSRYIIVIGFLSISIIVATLIFNPRAAFSWQDAVVLTATFVQAFLVLFIVHWIFHKSDLSLDAVVKLFAAGFLIAVPTAFVFEGLLVNFVLFCAWIVYDFFSFIFGEDFGTWIFGHWRMIWIIGELFNAYVVAAVTEELCKYYTFRAVEHPDLIFLTGLQRESSDQRAVEGGLVKYPFASLQVQDFVRQQSTDDLSTKSHRSNASSDRNSRRSKRSRRELLIEKTGTTDGEWDEDEMDSRTHRQRAMAITTGMISVAVGLTCAENFIYIFVLGGALGGSTSEEQHRGDLMEAWVVLFFRSIFPVHALAAAMQSINMIRKFVETDDQNGHRIGVGRIILPAVVLHGSFDAVLMAINVFIETAWDKYLEENEGNIGDEEPYNALAVNIVAWVGIILIMGAGLFWYYRENRKQRARLVVLEEEERIRQAEEEGLQWTPSSRSSRKPGNKKGSEIV